MEALGFSRGSYVVKVSNRKILDGVMEAIGLGGEENVARRLTVLRAIDKYDRVGRDGVEALLGKGRKDESGDFTKGAGLSSDQIVNVLSYVELQLAEDMGDLESVFDDWRRIVGASATGRDGVAELAQIAALCRTAGYASERVAFESSVVRGLEYYTGPVYEVELTFEIEDDEGRPVRFGSVGGGGRYDGLVGRFRGEDVPATGFSIGVSRLAAALKAQNSPLIGGDELYGPVVVLALDRDRLGDYQRMVQRLRAAGVRAELYLGSGGMGPQMKYADRRRAPCVVIQGSDERSRGEVQIKDLIAGARAADAYASHQEWRTARPGQFAVAEEKLVDAVCEVLDRHGIKPAASV
jgi:histidyl-tRNA synthetase